MNNENLSFTDLKQQLLSWSGEEHRTCVDAQADFVTNCGLKLLSKKGRSLITFSNYQLLIQVILILYGKKKKNHPKPHDRNVLLNYIKTFSSLALLFFFLK